MTSPLAIMAARFLRRSRRSSTSKVNFSVLTKTPGTDITVKVIIKFCTFRKIDQMYMLILVSMDLYIAVNCYTKFR